MKKSEQLYSLIECLDKSEKRRFQIYLSKYHKSSNAQELFEAITKLLSSRKINNKDNALRELGIKNLAYEKHRLKFLLIEFLGDFYKKNTNYTQIHALLIQISILLDKGQYSVAEELIDDGISLAKKMEAYHFLYELELQRIKMAKKRFNLSSNEFNQLLENNSKHLQDLGREFEYQKLQEKMYFWFVFSHKENPKEASRQTKSIIDNDLFVQEDQAISINEQKYLLRTKILYHRAIEEFDEMIKYQRKLNELYEKNLAYTQLHLSEYISNYYNSVGSYILADDYKEAKKILKKGDKIPKKFEEFFDNRIKETYYSFALMMNLNFLVTLDQYKKAKDYIEKNKEQFDYYLTKSPTFKADYFHFGALQAFSLGNYTETTKWCKRYEKEIEVAEKHQRIYWAVKILSVLAHFELGNKEKLTSQINTYYYLQRKYKVSDEYYKGVMKLFRKLQQELKPQELKRCCQKLLDLLEANPSVTYKGQAALEVWLLKQVKK